MFFELAPTFVNLLGWSLYIFLQKNNNIESSPVPWFLSIMMLSASGFSMINQGSQWGGAMYFTGMIPALVVFWFSLKNFQLLTWVEMTLIVFSFVLLFLSLFFSNISVLIISVYYVINYFVFFLKVYNKETVENPWPWGIWSLAGLFQIALIFKINSGNPFDFLIPLTLFICWFTMFVVTSKIKNLRPE